MRLALLGAGLAGLASAAMPALPALIVARVAAGACFGAVIPTSLTYVGGTRSRCRYGSAPCPT
ncbi:hypothetical protein ACFSTC_23495 [Nonomuraea ferruginea]